MTDTAVDDCPNCGAPLQLDQLGRCFYCHARVRTVPSFAEERGLMGALLKGFGLLVDEPAIKSVIEKRRLSGYSEVLSEAVIAARARVDGTGMAANAGGDELRIYQPAEIWTFNLAADLLALFVEADNVSKLKRIAGRDLMKVVDANLSSHWARSTIGQAQAPVELEPIRAVIPRRRLSKF